MTNGETRLCVACNTEKPITEFQYIRPYSHNGERYHECARCRKRAYDKEHYKRHGKKKSLVALRYGHSEISPNDAAEITALRIVEILEVAPELVTDDMWESICILLGGEPLSAYGNGARQRRIEKALHG